MPWLAIDAETGLPLWPDVYPRRALTNAFRHKKTGGLDSQAGDVSQKLIWGSESWNNILVEYVCRQGLTTQGSGVTFKKYYYSEDKKVQWLHHHWNEEDGRWTPTKDEFTIFPP